MFTVLIPPFHSLSLGSACFHLPSSVFAVLTLLFASSSLVCVYFNPPLPMFLILTPSFASLFVGSVCFHPPSATFAILTHTPIASLSLVCVCFLLPLSTFTIFTPPFTFLPVESVCFQSCLCLLHSHPHLPPHL